MSKTGFVYKIFCKTDHEMVYYGSTIQQVCSRINNHNAHYKSWKLGEYDFTTSFLIIDTGDWDYITVENVVYDEPFELRNRERWYIQNNECVNKNIPNNTPKQYYNQNAERFKEIHKKYRDDNKVKIKIYREQNETQIKEYHKQYREQNKKKINEKINCGCGSIVGKSYLSGHKKTKKHQKWLETQ